MAPEVNLVTPSFFVTRITVFYFGLAHVTIHTTLPLGRWPYAGNATLDLKLHADKQLVNSYLDKHFPGVPVTTLMSLPEAQDTKEQK